ncbi:YdcF family protein [Clostridium sp. AL.422]|uniref:YdcF family protein n=1 Tax=Clostridium TaxID=1485 RepID=UPI00293DACEA|nr:MULTISPECIES: YdcF family protein [unclassified Clostridium]MDV4149480.1 YdcF family protein [Clostridium sp. AL.422]
MKKNIDLLIGLVMISYVIAISLIFGKITFSEAFLVAGVILIIYHFIKSKISNNKVLNVLKFLVSIGLIIFFIVESAIVIFPKSNSIYSNYIIVLGAGVKGETPSLTLVQRLDQVLEYVDIQNNKVKIIVSGGQGNGENISEAEAMKRYLLEKGLKEEIIMEDQSRNTVENLRYSKDIIEKESNRKIKDLDVTIITSDFHALRANLIANSLGYGNRKFFTNKTLPILVPVMYSREFFAIIKYFLLN